MNTTGKKENCLKYQTCLATGKSFNCLACKYFVPKQGTQEEKDFLMEKKTSTKIDSLTDILFNQLNRLGTGNLEGDDLREEVMRAQAICGVSDQILKSTAVALKAHSMLETGTTKRLPKLLS